MELESDPNVGTEELEESPNLNVDAADVGGAGADPNEKPPPEFDGPLPPKTIPGASPCGCEPNVVGAGAVLPKVKAGVGAGVAAFVVAPKVGAEEGTSLSLPRRRLLRSSSLSILPRGTDVFDSVDGADCAPKLKLAAVVAGSALVC